jgi:hypothetical protein
VAGRKILDGAQLKSLSSRKATELLAKAKTPATEAAYLALAVDLEARIAQAPGAALTPPDPRFWREVVAEVRRRAWVL